MRTRREQMQAYRFVIRRIVAAVLSGEPETLDRPMRRLGISVFVSAMLAVLVFAGFGIYGLLTNPPSDPDEDGELILVRGTGAVFVSIAGQLHEVPNLASGRLILGDVEVRQVSQDSLVDIPRGQALGIPEAPAELPASGDLLGLPWRVCSVPAGAGQTAPTTTVAIDRSLAGSSESVGDRALYVATDPDNLWLLWNDIRLRIPSERDAIAFGQPPDPILVGSPLLGTITRGPDLEPPQIPRRGQDSGRVLGGEPADYGDLFVVGGQHYLLHPDGLGLVHEATVALLDNDVREGVREIDPAEAGNTFTLEDGAFPATIPDQHPAAGGRPTICTAYEGEAEGVLGTTIEIFDSAPQELSTGAGAIPLTQTDRDPVPPADQAVIAGGRGALVQEIPHAEDEPREQDTVYLITDQGIRYPIDGESVGRLGYGEVAPVRVPADLLALVPRGPTLSEAAARQPLYASPQPGADPG
jgi:type VII secretion protein EccB